MTKRPVVLAALGSLAVVFPLLLFASSQGSPRKEIIDRIAAQRRAQEAEMRISELEAMLQAAYQNLDTMMHLLAASKDASDRRALDALQKGQIAAGAAAAEEQARARDARATVSAVDRLSRAEEWKRFGAVAFLESTALAIKYYEQALTFSPRDPEILDRLAWLYERQVRVEDRAAMAKRLVEMPDADSRARGLIHLGDISLNANDGAKARPVLEEAVSVARNGKSPRLEAKATSYLAGALTLLGQYGEADALVARALALTRANGFRYEEAEALCVSAVGTFARVGAVSGAQGDVLREADQRFIECEGAVRGLSDGVALAHVLVWRARVARLKGDLRLSETLVREALAVFERLDVRTRLGFAQQQLASTLAAQGRYSEALPYFRSAVENARQTSQPGYEGVALIEWAQAEAAQSNMSEACRLITEGQAALTRTPGTDRVREQAHPVALKYCQAGDAAIAEITRRDTDVPVHEAVIAQGFEAVWTRANALLAGTKERLAVSDKKTGLLITEVTGHGLFGSRYDKYLLAIQQLSARSTKVVLKVVSYHKTGEYSGDWSHARVVLAPADPAIASEVAFRFLERLKK